MMVREDVIDAIGSFDARDVARIGAAWAARLAEIARLDPIEAAELEIAMTAHMAARRLRP